MQSPGMVPIKNNPQGRANLYGLFLSKANCSSLQCLRAAPSSALIDANEYIASNGGGPTAVGFGPVVDGDYVPDLPIRLLCQGRFHKNLKGIISANNAHEVRTTKPSSLRFGTCLNISLREVFIPGRQKILSLVHSRAYAQRCCHSYPLLRMPHSMNSTPQPLQGIHWPSGRV
jgi:carboxylesterase type B